LEDVISFPFGTGVAGNGERRVGNVVENRHGAVFLFERVNVADSTVYKRTRRRRYYCRLDVAFQERRAIFAKFFDFLGKKRTPPTVGRFQKKRRKRKTASPTIGGNAVLSDAKRRERRRLASGSDVKGALGR
jgi:hypothetical protein